MMRTGYRDHLISCYLASVGFWNLIKYVTVVDGVIYLSEE